MKVEFIDINYSVNVEQKNIECFKMHLKLRENNNFEKLHPLNGEVFNFIHHFVISTKGFSYRIILQASRTFCALVFSYLMSMSEISAKNTRWRKGRNITE